MCMFVCAYVGICACVGIQLSVSVDVSMCVFVCADMYLCVCTYSNMHAHMNIHVFSRVPVNVCVCGEGDLHYYLLRICTSLHLLNHFNGKECNKITGNNKITANNYSVRDDIAILNKDYYIEGMWTTR